MSTENIGEALGAVVGFVLVICTLITVLLVGRGCEKDRHEFHLEKMRIERQCPKAPEANPS